MSRPTPGTQTRAHLKQNHLITSDSDKQMRRQSHSPHFNRINSSVMLTFPVEEEEGFYFDKLSQKDQSVKGARLH